MNNFCASCDFDPETAVTSVFACAAAIRVGIRLDCVEQPGKVRFALGTVDFGGEACCASTWPQEFAVKCSEVDRLFARG